MPRLLQINVVANSGSTGHIAEALGHIAIVNGWESYIVYGRWACASESKLIRVGSCWDIMFHAFKSFFGDRHGCGSRMATKRLISRLQQIEPSIIHLHNIHGYYLNYKILFNYLSKTNIPVIWTLHDCWSITGHCVHFQNIECYKWEVECFHCPNLYGYPKSYFIDNSRKNYLEKKRVFTSVQNLTIVPVCNWLDQVVSRSFLKDINRQVIINGIDLDVFIPRETKVKIKTLLRIEEKIILLAVATVWNKTKGWDDILALRKRLSDNFVIIIVGVNSNQKRMLPYGIIGFERTESVTQLVNLYSSADVFVNPTYEDTLPTVNIEALACGTPVITYETGGSADIIDPSTGFSVKRGDVGGLLDSILKVTHIGKDLYIKACRARAEKLFNKKDRFKEYWNLYNQLLK